MPGSESFKSLWADAVAQYEKHTDRKVATDHTFQEYQHLEDLETAIARKREQFGEYRTEHRRIHSTFAKCITPLQPMLRTTQAALGSTPFAPAAAVLGAASYLLQACESVTKAYDGIEELFESMCNITTRVKEYECREIDSSLQIKMTNILAHFLEIFGVAEGCIKRRRFKQWVRHTLVQDDSISASLKRLKNYIESELGLVVALTSRHVKDMRADMKASNRILQADVDELLASQRNDRQKSISSEEQRKLMDRLKTNTIDETAREHASNVEKLTKDTGDWIRRDSMFQDWEQEKAPLLWVFGKPGVGKTMLAARTIEMLRSRYPQHSEIPSLTSVSYLYFKGGNPRLQDCTKLWKTAALQIAKVNVLFKKHVIKLVDEEETFASAIRIWQRLFLDFFKEDTPSQFSTSLAFIIVDGLDEGTEVERGKFLACLSELVSQSTKDCHYRVQVIVFARPEIRADLGFKVSLGIKERTIEITPEKNTVDIDRFIQDRLKIVSMLETLKKRGASKEYQMRARYIYNSVRSRSQGMFLWASLAFDQIQDLSSPEAIENSLREAPKDLDNMLYHVLKRLDVKERLQQSYLHDLLSWVFCAFWPLQISDLFVLLLTSASQHCYMLEDHLEGRYSSLFHVSPGSVDFDPGSEEFLTALNDDALQEDDFGFLYQAEDEENGGDVAQSAMNTVGEQEDLSLTDNSNPATQHDDTEGTFQIPGSWNQRTVEFSHARIRDYLATEGDRTARRWHDCSIIPYDLDAGHVEAVLACIHILCSDVTVRYKTGSLKTYALVNWMKHLNEINFSNVSESVDAQLAHQLVRLFCDGEGLLKVAIQDDQHFIKSWLLTNIYSSLVRHIITRHVDDLDQGERDWALSVSLSARALFQPLVAACARKWLHKSGWDDEAYVDVSTKETWIMHAWNSITDEGLPSENVLDSEDIPLDALKNVANLEPLPKDEHWYTSVAWTMLMENPYGSRIGALELRPGGWAAHEGLATCYSRGLRGYEAAIKEMTAAVQTLPETETFRKLGVEFSLECRIAKWKIRLSGDEEALESAQRAYERSHSFTYGTGSLSSDAILTSIRNCIEALYRSKQYFRLAVLLQEVNTRDTLEARSLWSVFLRAQTDPYFNVNIFEKAERIAQKVDDTEFLDCMRDPLKQLGQLDAASIAESQVAQLAVDAAQWLYKYGPQVSDAVEIWETVVSLADQSDEVVQQYLYSHRNRAAGSLAMVHFEAATNSLGSGEDVSHHITALESLAMLK
ncbi:MAG: hypothetical protein Q9181_002690 [Wetmoreana brouardii]